MLWYLLAGLAPVAAVLFLIWTHRKRSAARVAASSKRFEQIFGATAQRAATPSSTPGASSASTGRGPPAPVSEAPAARAYVRKERLLDSRHASLFRMLTAVLPEYTVLVHVSLAAVIDIPTAVHGREREQRVRALAQNVIDCLVCSDDMAVVAAVDLETGDSAESRIKSECLKAAQVRYVRIDPAAFTGATEVRKLLLDATG